MKRFFSFGLLLGFTLIILLTSMNLYAQPSIPVSKASITGYVKDSSTLKPIKGAIIVVQGGYRMDKYNFTTDSNGFFNATVPIGQPYRIYVFTQENDYVPVYCKTPELTKKGFSLEIKLVPGALVIFEGEYYEFEYEKAADYLGFTVQTVEGFKLYQGPYNGNITAFGSYPPEVKGLIQDILGFNPRYVIIPANVKTIINVTAVWRIIVDNKPKYVSKSVSIGSPSGMVLPKGGTYSINLSNVTLAKSIKDAEAFLKEIDKLLAQAEGRGFYLTAEKSDLNKAFSKLDKAKRDYKLGRLASVYAGLREIKLIGDNIYSILSEAYSEAFSSTPFIMLILAFVSTSLALYVTEKKGLQAIIFILVYLFFYIVVYASYPGFRLYPLEMAALLSVASAFIIFGLAEAAPKIIREKPTPRGVAFWSAIVAIFSAAKRNLRRRRLQTTLAMISMVVMVWAIMVLTSYASMRGVVVLKQVYPPSYHGLLVKNIGVVKVGEAIYKLPTRLPEEVLAVLEGEEGVKEYYVRYTSFVAEKPLGTLITGNGLKERIYGVVAMSPREAKLIGFTSFISGDYPTGSGEIALTSSLAESLKLSIGDEVEFNGKVFKVVGIIDSTKLAQFKDLDGRVLYPYKLFTYLTEQGVSQVISPVRDNEVIFISLSDAHELELTPTSILAVVDERNIEGLARRLAILGVKVWYTAFNSVYKAEYGNILEVKGGLSTLVPATMVILTIFMTFISSVYQRKREVMTLSSIGVNPTYIVFLFVSEAIIAGLLSGGIGYLLSLPSYRILQLFGTALEVRQKVSAAWGAIALSASILVAILGSIYPAYKGAFVVVPSMLRRFRLESSRVAGTHEVPIPLKIPSGLAESFVDFVIKRFKEYKGGIESIEDVLATEEEIRVEGRVRRIIFSYEYPDGMIRARTVNELELKLPRESRFWGIVLKCTPVKCSFPEEAVYRTTRLIRRIALEWSSRMKLGEPEK